MWARRGWIGGRQVQMMATLDSMEDQAAAGPLRLENSSLLPLASWMILTRRMMLIAQTKNPKANTNIRANFCLVGRRSRASVGIGGITTTISVTICSAALRHHTTAKDRHVAGTEWSQNPRTGRQIKKVLNRVHRPTMPIKTRKTMRRIRKRLFVEAKRRIYSRIMEILASVRVRL